MSLGDFIPNNLKKNLLLPDGLKIGMVLRAFVNFTNPPKEKRFVIVGFKDDSISVASVLINTNVNLNINYNQELQSQHLFFENEDRTYLTHDSYIDCSCIHELSLSEINEKVDVDPTIVIGSVEKDDLNIIMNTLVDSDFIKGKHKKRYGFYEYNFDNEQDLAAE